MFCYNCNFDNTESSIYCGHCGHQIRCRACHAPINSPQLLHCTSCGEKLNGTPTVMGNINRADLSTDTSSVADTKQPQDHPSENIVSRHDRVKEHTTRSIPEDKIFIYSEGDYAYARCVEVTDKGYRFFCIDDYSNFFLTHNAAAKIKKHFVKGSCLWAVLDKETHTSKSSQSYSPYIPEKPNIRKESKRFYDLHQKGEILKAPIQLVENSYIQVSLTPNFTSRIRIPIEKQNNYTTGQIVTLRIERMEETNGKVFVSLSVVDNQVVQGMLMWRQLPTTLSPQDFEFPRDILKQIKVNGCDKLLEIEDSHSFYKSLAPLYSKEYGDRRITYHQTYQCYYMEFDTRIKNSKGVPIYVCFKKPKSEAKWICNLIGFASAEKEFEKMATAIPPALDGGLRLCKA